MSPKKPDTVRVVSTTQTWIKDGLPELTANRVVELPAELAPSALELDGVILAPDSTLSTPKE